MSLPSVPSPRAILPEISFRLSAEVWSFVVSSRMLPVLALTLPRFS
jgi:hypothetical protein